MRQDIKDRLHVNIPFDWLMDSYLERFLEHRLNPEIGLGGALQRFDVSEFKRIADAFHEKGLSITLHAPFEDLSPGSPDPGIWDLTRQRFEQALELVPFFRPRTVVCHAGYDQRRYGYLREIWIENSVKMWSWLGVRLQDAGSRLMLENVYEKGPEEIRVLFERLENEPVGFCLDTGHCFAFGAVGLESWIRELGVYLGQVHLHDNGGNEDEHLGLGRGRIDFTALFAFLESRKAPFPIITLEPHKEADLWHSLEYLEKLYR
jgi:sugar phosphate isomerase/epimerase